MNLRLALYQLAAERGLSRGDTQRLQQIAAHDAEPAGVASHLPRTLGVIAAALGGFGLILWIAANWAAFSRTGRFALLESVVLVAGLAAWLRPGMRAPFALFAFLGTGALFALFGQTYQTGADPWQLFAVWAVLGLPLCLGARSDIVWAPWAIVVMTALSLWGLDHRQVSWWSDGSQNLEIDLVCWLLSIALVVWLSRAFERVTGAGIWSLRAAITLAIVPVAFSTVRGVFGSHMAATFPVGLLVLIVAAGLLSLRPVFDIFALSIVMLAIDVVLISGFAWMVGSAFLNGDFIGAALVIAVVSVVILTLSVKWVMRVARTHAAEGAVT